MTLPPLCWGVIALGIIVAVIYGKLASRGLERVIDDPYRKD